MTGFINRVTRVWPAAGFSVLTGLCGAGIAWFVACLFAKYGAGDYSGSLPSKVMPLLTVGGIGGIILGIAVSTFVWRVGPQAEEQLEQKFLGEDGREQIYLGVILSAIITLMPFIGWIGRLVGPRVDIFVEFGIGLGIVAASLVFYDRLPRRFIIPAGIIGWVLAVAVGFWFCCSGLGAFGN
jgi:hypothetical protein